MPTPDSPVSPRPDRDLWTVPEVPILSRSGHDRSAHRRTDEGWLERAWQSESSRVVVVSASGKVAVRSGPSGPDLALIAPADAEFAGIRVLLGTAGGLCYFALLAEQDLDGPGWLGLRELAERLTDLDVGLLTAAVALQAWHQRHRHCPRCGAVTEVEQAGWTRRCPLDSSEHFPRTDPAVIMLVHDGAGRCVLARGPQWPSGRMSVLAGFVEAGESAEAAVAREVAEEVGISVTDVCYVASQPHPFPGSLMLGFTARLAGDPTLHIDAQEIIEAGWFTRAEVRGTGDWGTEDTAVGRRAAEGAAPQPGGGSVPVLRGLPGRMSIARQLINNWLAEGD